MVALSTTILYLKGLENAIFFSTKKHAYLLASYYTTNPKYDKTQENEKFVCVQSHCGIRGNKEPDIFAKMVELVADPNCS